MFFHIAFALRGLLAILLPSEGILSLYQKTCFLVENAING